MAKATAYATGYFGVVREPGTEFDVPEGTKSNSWFTIEGEEIEAPEAPVVKKGKKKVEGEEIEAPEAP